MSIFVIIFRKHFFGALVGTSKVSVRNLCVIVIAQCEHIICLAIISRTRARVARCEFDWVRKYELNVRSVRNLAFACELESQLQNTVHPSGR